MLRSCYLSKWTFPGETVGLPPGPVTVPGFYCFSPPNTPQFPSLHYFGSLNWVTDDREYPQNPVYGEVSPDPVTNPRPYWIGRCVPPPNPPTVQGGVVLGGEATTQLVTYFPMAGGVVAGGQGTYYTRSTYYADGGLVAGGTSPAVYSYRADGGLVEGGATRPSPPVPPIPPPPAHGAGLILGGDGTHPLRTLYYASAGVVLGGEAETPLTTIYRADGGLVAGGEAEAPLQTDYHADGGLVAGGEADTPLQVAYRADGGLVLGGASAPLFSTFYRADGGLVLGDAPPTSTYSILDPGCSNYLPNVMHVIYLAALCPFQPPRDQWIIYDSADSKWKGALPIPAPGLAFRLELYSTGPLFSDWRLHSYCAASGESDLGAPVLGDCASVVWEFSQGPALIIACGCTPMDDFLFRIVAP